MLASSALVLTALTVTGVYVRSSHRNTNPNNVLDLSAIESGVDESAENSAAGEDMGTIFAEVGTDDLDYDPFFQEANSVNVENERRIGNTQESSTEDSEEESKDKSDANSQSGKDTEDKPDADSQSGKNTEDKSEKEKEKKDGEQEGMFDESSKRQRQLRKIRKPLRQRYSLFWILGMKTAWYGLSSAIS